MILDDEAALQKVAERLAPLLKVGDIVTLSGPLSAGKTSFARALLRALGHDGEVPSPSFAIVQPYESLSPPVWHTDLYRIEDASEVAELGLDDVVRDSVLLVEWPERTGARTWPSALALSLEVLDTGARRLTAEVPAAWEGRWPPR
jgi:tRNA threonylcarbamoyladenosine biosynthesis protein TsaE